MSSSTRFTDFHLDSTPRKALLIACGLLLAWCLLGAIRMLLASIQAWPLERALARIETNEQYASTLDQRLPRLQRAIERVLALDSGDPRYFELQSYFLEKNLPPPLSGDTESIQQALPAVQTATDNALDLMPLLARDWGRKAWLEMNYGAGDAEVFRQQFDRMLASGAPSAENLRQTLALANSYWFLLEQEQKSKINLWLNAWVDQYNDRSLVSLLRRAEILPTFCLLTRYDNTLDVPALISHCDALLPASSDATAKAETSDTPLADVELPAEL